MTGYDYFNSRQGLINIVDSRWVIPPIFCHGIRHTPARYRREHARGRWTAVEELGRAVHTVAQTHHYPENPERQASSGIESTTRGR